MLGLFIILIKVIGGKIGIAKAGLLIAKSRILRAAFEEFSEEFLYLGQRALMNPGIQNALPNWMLNYLEERIDDLQAAVEAIKDFLDSMS